MPRLVTCGIALTLLIAPRATTTAAELSVGIATIDITPPLGYRMAGYYQERANTGTKDPLKAKAMVLRQGDVQAALVFCDLVAISPQVSRLGRARARERTGIVEANVAICATHSHTGPLYYGVLQRFFHERAIATKGADPHETLDYSDQLAGKLAAVIAEAQSRLRPARLAAGAAREDRLAFNRRFHMKDGSVVFNPGQRNPAIVRAAGPIDPEVGLLEVFAKGSDRPEALLTVYALHLDTVGGTEYSADYPYHLERTLRERLGPELVSMFGAGACGDINHVDVSAQARRPAGEIGAMLGESVLAALPALRPIASPSLAARRATVDVPVQPHRADEVARAREALDRVGSPALPFLDAVRAVKLVDLDQNYPGGKATLEVQVFRLGPETAIVTLPGEVFVELGLAIKRGSPFRDTLVIELANDIPSYIPTRKAFGEGSYEVVNSRVEPGGGEAMVEAALSLLKSLAP